MNAAARRRLAALTGRAVLLAGILAVVAGILGMHALTGNHAAHTLGAGPPPSSAVATPRGPGVPGGHGHSGHGHSGQGQSGTAQGQSGVAQGERGTVQGAPGSDSAPAAECTGSLGSTELPAAACTPLAKAGSLVAPDPGSVGHLADARVSPGAGSMRFYPYLPDGPSPGDLSISRT